MDSPAPRDLVQLACGLLGGPSRLGKANDEKWARALSRARRIFHLAGCPDPLEEFELGSLEQAVRRETGELGSWGWGGESATIGEAFERRAEFPGLELYKTLRQFRLALVKAGMPSQMLVPTRIGPTEEGLAQGDFSDSVHLVANPIAAYAEAGRRLTIQRKTRKAASTRARREAENSLQGGNRSTATGRSSATDSSKPATKTGRSATQVAKSATASTNRTGSRKNPR